jgi:hypothetical protein
MKKHRGLQAVLLTAILSSPLAYAADESKDHAQHHPHGAASAEAAPPAEDMAPVDMKKYLQDMQATLLKMHDLSHKIQQNKNAKEREKLKEEHLQLMGRHMEMVAPLMMQMMMGAGAHEGDMEADEGTAEAQTPPDKK